MRQRLNNWFELPVFLDEDTSRLAEMLNVITLVSLGVGIPLVLTQLVFADDSFSFERAPWFGLSLFMLAVVSQLLLRQSRVRFASVFFLLGTWCAAAVSVLFEGGLTSPTYLFFAPIALMSGIFLGRRYTTFITTITILFSIVVFFLGRAGYLTPPMLISHPGDYLISVIGSTLAVATLLYLAVRGVDEASRRIESANQQLSEAQAFLERRVEERTRDLTLAADIGRVVSQIRDLDELLIGSVELIRNRFDLYYTQIYLVDEAERTLTLRAGTGLIGAELVRRGHRLLIGPGSINGMAAADRHAVIVSDTSDSDIFLPNPLLPETRSEMSVPLLVGESRVVGVLNLQSNQPYALTRESLSAFEALAGQLAIAIDNVQLISKLSAAQSELEAQTQRLTRDGWSDFLDGVDERRRIGYLFEQDRLQVLNALEPTSAESQRVMDVPIEIVGQQLGRIRLEAAEGSAWTTEDQEFVEAIARQVAQQIDNLRLLTQAERYRKAAEMANRRLTLEGWEAFMSEDLPQVGYHYDLHQVILSENGTVLNGNGHENGVASAETPTLESGAIQPLKVGEAVIGELAVDQVANRDQEDVEQLVSAVARQLSAHIENLRLVEQTELALGESRRRAEELVTVNRILSRLSSSLDLLANMDVIAHELAEAVNVDQVGIALFNEDRTRLTVVAEHNDAERSPAAIGATIPLEGNLATQRVVANRQILLIDDPATHPLMGSAQGVLEERGVKKLAIMPMIVGNEIVGTVGMDILDESKSFSAEQLRLAETVVYQAASAVQAARLFEQTQSALAETESLYASSSALNQADTYEDVLDVIREYSAIGQDADMLSLSYFNEPWQDDKRPEWIQVLATWQRYGEPVETPVSYSMDQFPTLEEVTRDQPLLLPDIVNDERLNEHTRQLLVDQAQMRSHLFAPMVVGERWVGILGVGGHQPTRYRPSDVRRLMVMVGQAATTVQSLVLFQETRELLQREQRQRRIADSLARAARRLSHALGEAQRRQVIVDEIFDVLQPDVVRLFSWNDENSAFQLLNQHAGPDSVLPLDAPVIGSMHTQEARPDLWRVYSQQSSWLNQLETPEDATISAEQYCLPWYIGQDVVGVVEVVACGEGVQIRQEDQAICEGIAQQGATAIQNALLWEQTQEALVFQERLASQLRTVSEVGTAVTTLLDLDLLLQRVVTLTKESFNLYHAHIYVLDDLNNKLVLRAGAGDIGRQMVAERREISLGDESIVANAALTGDVVVANDVLSVTNFLPHPLLPETRAEMAVPMIVGQDLVGVLDVQADEENYFSADDILIMQTLAGQIAVAVQNAFLYAEQVQTTDKLREVDQLKSEFLASMSHELRTPLNSIIGFADVLLAGIDGELNDRMEEDVRLIRNSGNHLRELIGDILDMSKIEAGRMELQYELINVDGLVNDVVQSARVSAEEKGLQLKAEIAGDVDTLYADRTRLRQVLVNVVGNAIKFTERGYVHVSVRHIEDQMLFSVEDTGIGIRKEHLPLVFEQFRQIDTSKSGTAGGSGLGMPISKVLVEMHEGRIWVESEHGEGSTFYFTIPNKALPARD